MHDGRERIDGRVVLDVRRGVLEAHLVLYMDHQPSMECSRFNFPFFTAGVRLTRVIDSQQHSTKLTDTVVAGDRDSTPFHPPENQTVFCIVIACCLTRVTFV